MKTCNILHPKTNINYLLKIQSHKIANNIIMAVFTFKIKNIMVIEIYREIRSKEASMFTRLGRAAGKQQAFMRLGRAPSLYTRMGRAPSLYTRMGRAQQMFTRIGRSPKGGYMRLGRAKPQAFMRIGRAAQLFTRMGRLNADQQTRIGRAANMFTRMGRSGMKMDHLKRADFIFTRLGKRSMQVITCSKIHK